LVKKHHDENENIAPDELAFDVNLYRGGLRAILEAILIVTPEPQAPEKLAKALAVTVEDVRQTLANLAEEYLTDARGFQLREFDGAWRFYSAPEYGEVVAKYIVGGAETRLSPAALETLAVIAYRQPVTRAAVASIRGVNVDGVFRTLLQRGLIAEAEDKAGGKAYVTTGLFLEKVGINNLAELEPLAPFLPDDIDFIPEFEDIRKRTRIQDTESEEQDMEDIELGNDNE
jgi:segregation and condensation protein B